MRAVIPYRIRIPGTWVTTGDTQEDSDIWRCLNLAQSAFAEASLALGGFVTAGPTMPTPTEYRAELAERNAIETTVRREFGVSDFDPPRENVVEIETDCRMIAQKFGKGILPRSVAHHLPFLYAKAFVYVLDEFRRHLASLERFGSVTCTATSARAELAALLPDLEQVRHSVAHVDERAQWLGPLKKTLDPKPVTTRMLNAPAGGVVEISQLDGDDLCCTMGDGRQGRVPVNREAFDGCVAIYQKLVDNIRWKGPPSVEPHW